MKNILALLMILLTISGFAQSKIQRVKVDKVSKSSNTGKIDVQDLPVLYISKDINIVFKSPEPIQLVDVSSDYLISDIPVDNLTRIKVVEKGAEDYLGVVTIVGQSFVSQFSIVYTENMQNVNPYVDILPSDMYDLDYPNIELTDFEIQSYCNAIIKDFNKSKKGIARKKKHNLYIKANNVYTVGNYVFVDINLQNISNIRYDIEDIRFSINDSKVKKSTNYQNISVEPVYQLYNRPYFYKNYRNVFVFKKFTIPNNKIFNIKISEKQVSGRSISLDIKYKHLLNADTF